MPHTLDTRHRAFIPRQAPGRLSPDGSVAVLRILSVMAGAALGAWGLRRGGPAGVVTALVGIGLLARGIAGPGLLVTPLASNRSRRWAIAGREVRPGEARGDARYNAREAAVDEAVEESFPASDPPAWTSTGIGRVAARPEGSLVGAGVSPEPESLPGGTKSPLPRYWPAEDDTERAMTPELTDLLRQSLPEVLALRDRAPPPQQHGVELRAGADDYASPGEIEMHLNDASASQSSMVA